MNLQLLKYRQRVLDALVAAAVHNVGTDFQKLIGKAVPWATYNYLGGFIGGTAKGPNYATQGGVTVAEIKMDFAAISAARAAAGQAVLAQNDLLQIMGIPTGILVPTVASTLDTAEGVAATVDVGDSAAGAQYSAARDLNAAVGNRVISAFANAKFYAADDNVVLKLNSAGGYVKNVSHWFVLMADMRNTR